MASTAATSISSAEYKVDKDLQEIGGADNRERAKFWEIWHKGMHTVVWVAEGCELVLDVAEPDELAQLQNFFPCPMPAYTATQPGSLIPVPDVLQYKDQLDEVNTLTGRLHALAQYLEVKGFYPAGSAEISRCGAGCGARRKSPGRVLVPISNWAAFGGSKEVIIWMPIDMIANTITAVIAVRKQIIEDIYQMMGLSDIMRGATDPGETLGAQQLKSQYGSRAHPRQAGRDGARVRATSRRSPPRSCAASLRSTRLIADVADGNPDRGGAAAEAAGDGAAVAGDAAAGAAADAAGAGGSAGAGAWRRRRTRSS